MPMIRCRRLQRWVLRDKTVMTKVLDQSTGLEDKRARLLAALLKKKHIERLRTRTIPRRAVHSPCVLSFAQQRLWLLDRLSPVSAAYNIPLTIRLTGHLNQAALELAINTIVRRHEVLRTRFQEFEGEPRQVIAGSGELLLEKVDLSGWQGAEQQKEVRERALREAQIPFDLAQGPLLRVKLLGLGETEHVLLVTMHHIVSDGWSLGIMMREFAAFYRAYSEGEGVPLPELELQYADYAMWQREGLAGGELQEQMGYWKEQLAGLERLDLPTDHPRPAVMSHRGATVEMELGEELTARIRELGRREEMTLFMALLAGVQVLLGRYAGQQEVVVGTPIANRTRQEIEPLIGFFVNTLVLRGEVRSEWSFREMLKRVREVTLAAYAHQDVPFEQLVEELQPVRDLSRNPLFQVMLLVQNAPQESFSLPGLSVEALDTEDGGVAKFDLMFAAAESGEKIRVGINYATELYEPATIERMARHFRAVVETMTRNADSRIGEVTILSDAERAQLEEWNRTEREYPQRWVHELFEDQVKRTPGAVAVEYGDQHLNYEELNRRANQLAHYLRNMGVGPEVLVGICMERSLEMVVGMLGVLKAGGAYVPLDPAYPAKRLQYMLGDTQAPVLLTQSEQATKIAGYAGKIVELDREWERISSHSTANPVCQVSGENLAYVIYTSGSTGWPKGVGIRHASAMVLLHWGREVFGEEELSGVLAATSICFDLSVFEIFVPLSWGGKVILAANALELPGMAGREQVKLVNTVPSVMKELLRSEGVPRSVVTVNLAGEALLANLVREVYRVEGVKRVLNLYGPSEDTTYSTWAWIGQEEADGEGKAGVSIGKPVANRAVYVLDEELQPVPVGVAGELYIGGAGLARGYVNQPGLTAERFVPNRFASSGGERLYRTKDRARWRGDGNLEYLGRLDQQVKIRGCRIELGEIEAALQKQAGVAQAAVVVQEDGSGDKRLVAYVVGEVKEEGSGQVELKGSELRRQLRERLPEYMVPSAYMQIEELPLNANGKLDRKRLPALAVTPAPRQSHDIQDSVEASLQQIWAEVLDRSNIGVSDNFFETGGHSMKAVLLSVRISRAFQKEIPVRLVFDKPTIEEQALFLRGDASLNGPGSLVPIQRTGSRQPIFCVHPFFGLAHCYQELSSLLGPDQPFYGLQCYGLETDQTPLSTIPEMAKFYLQAIRTVQPRGPFQLAGWSMGALIAYEIARQLVSKGETVSFLALFEGHVPQPAVPSSAPSHNEWEKLVDEREAENFRYMARRVPTSEQEASDTLLQMGRYLAEFTQVSTGFSREQLTRLSRIIAINQLAVESYRPGSYPGNVSLFRVPGQADAERSYGWAELVGGELKIFEVPGTHDGFMSAPSVNIIASHMKCLLHAGNLPSEKMFDRYS